MACEVARINTRRVDTHFMDHTSLTYTPILQ
jgi:hypothetical protein